MARSSDLPREVFSKITRALCSSASGDDGQVAFYVVTRVTLMCRWQKHTTPSLVQHSPLCTVSWRVKIITSSRRTLKGAVYASAAVSGAVGAK